MALVVTVCIAITQLFYFKPVAISMVSNTLLSTTVDRTSTCTMIDATGIISTFTCSMEMPFLDYYEIIGTKDSLKGHGIIELRNQSCELLKEHMIKDDQYLRQIEYFERQEATQQTAERDLQQSLEMAYYLERAYASAQQKGELIQLEELDYA